MSRRRRLQVTLKGGDQEPKGNVSGIIPLVFPSGEPNRAQAAGQRVPSCASPAWCKRRRVGYLSPPNHWGTRRAAVAAASMQRVRRLINAGAHVLILASS